ncbi:MAG TPA: hypothetical protein VNE67_06160 [Acetobacteraceae bacterium]|nr:hypothetical protein [Acetobacteraceae bacterium]
MKIKRIAHIAIAARTLAPAIDLFRDIFGIAPAYEAQIGSIRLAMLPVWATCPELLEDRDEVLAAIGDRWATRTYGCTTYRCRNGRSIPPCRWRPARVPILTHVAVVGCQDRHTSSLFSVAC